MIAGGPCRPTEWLITERLDGFQSGLDRAGGTVEVQVVLRTIPQIVTEVGPLCEPLENHEVNAFRGEGADHFLVGVEDAVMPDRIVLEIRCEPFVNPGRKFVPAAYR